MTNFTNEFSAEVWTNTYKIDNEATIQDTFNRIAKGLASPEKDKEKWEKIFSELLGDFKFVPGGRILSNIGRENLQTTLYNCFVSAVQDLKVKDPDSIEGIYAMLTKQAQTLKSEGGYGVNGSWIRPEGSYVQGIASRTPGVLKFMELWDKSSEVITSGCLKTLDARRPGEKIKIRKGAQMLVLEIWHPEIEEFIIAKQTPNRLTKFNMSVGITEGFMEAVQKNADWDLCFPDTTHVNYKKTWDGNIEKWRLDGNPVIVYKTVKAVDLWNSITKATYDKAEPGILFIDLCNNLNPINYAENVRCTNPSLRKGTKVLTEKGPIAIDKLEGKDFKVYDLKHGYSDATCRLSGKEKPLYEIELSSGFKYYATKEHRWATQDGEKTTAGLASGDKLPILRKRKVFGGTLGSEDEGFLIGWLLGDGWVTLRSDNNKKQIGFIVSELDFSNGIGDKIVRILNGVCDFSGGFNKRERKNKSGKTSVWYEINTQNDKLAKWLEKFGSPCKKTGISDKIFEEASEKFISGMVNGYFSSDGYVDKKAGESSDKNRIVFTSANKKLLKDFSEIFGFYGIISKLSTSTSNSSFPNQKDYKKKYTRHDLFIRDTESFKWFAELFKSDLDYKQERLDILKKVVRKKGKETNYIQVFKVSLTDKKEDVWDITVDNDNHCFCLSHCITHNCGEINMSTGVCCLGSMNLTQYIIYGGKKPRFDYESFERDIPFAIRALDNVQDVSKAPLKEYSDSVKNKRRIGLGVMGLGSIHFILGIPFGSKESMSFISKLFKVKSETEILASALLGKEKGDFLQFDKDKHFQTHWWKNLKISKEVKNQVEKIGCMRNSHQSMNAPTGNTGIYANNVSGGIEPVFMAEYIRWSIVDEKTQAVLMAEGFKFPLVHKGQWFETDLMKLSKRGDDPILVGEFNGQKYEIDKSRGLTKATLIRDYGWKRVLEVYSPEDIDRMKKEGIFKTTENLSVQEHLDSLAIVSHYTNQACSKTVNVPNKYPYEDFKDIYLTAWKSGIKGITTYREGTMSAVLESQNANKDDSNNIVETRAPKRPESLRGEIYPVKYNGENLYVALGFLKGGLYEVFAGINPDKDIKKSDGSIFKKSRGKYVFNCDDGTDYNLHNGHSNEDADSICRLLSSSLRHGVPLEFLVQQLEKTKGSLVSFSKVICRVIKKHVKDNTKISGEDCPTCGSELIREAGCKLCKTCGYSVCG